MKFELLNWIYLTKCDPLWQQHELTRDELLRQKKIAAAVRQAVATLTVRERFVIEKRYFEGAAFALIAAELGKSEAAVVNLHRRALRRLQKLLADFARDHYGITTVSKCCCICNSSHRAEIDEIIRAKKPEEPYRVVIAEIKARFGIRIKSPQTIIGHLKYHS